MTAWVLSISSPCPSPFLEIYRHRSPALGRAILRWKAGVLTPHTVGWRFLVASDLPVRGWPVGEEGGRHVISRRRLWFGRRVALLRVIGRRRWCLPCAALCCRSSRVLCGCGDESRSVSCVPKIINYPSWQSFVRAKDIFLDRWLVFGSWSYFVAGFLARNFDWYSGLGGCLRILRPYDAQNDAYIDQIL